MKTIVIDPGHGGHDPGAVAASGLRESAVALKIAQALVGELRRANLSLRVLLTRAGDVFLSLAERSKISNSADADLFLSIHCNAASNVSASGFEVFTTPGQTAADLFATALYDAYKAAFPNLKPRPDLSDGDPDKEANFAVLRATRAPAALFEVEFLSNPEAARWLAQPDTPEKIAAALATGILRHLGVERTPDIGPAVPATPSAKPDAIAIAREHLQKALAALS